MIVTYYDSNILFVSPMTLLIIMLICYYVFKKYSVFMLICSCVPLVASAYASPLSLNVNMLLCL